MKLITKIAVVGCLGMAISAQAAMTWNTGWDANTDTLDDNGWLVGGNPAYIAVPDNTPPPGQPLGYPLDGTWWLPNDNNSAWITHTYPIDDSPMGPSGNNISYRYTLSFTLGEDTLMNLRWLSDNTSTGTVLLGGGGSLAMGTHAVDPFNTWMTVAPFVVPAGTHTLAFEVINLGQNGLNNGNPAGLRVEFGAVPEPATIAAGALLLLPFAVSTIRRFRKN